MPAENISALWKKLQEDPGLRRQLDAMPAQSRAEAVANLVRLGAEQGLPFTAEEFAQTAVVTDVAMSDQDLEGVVGGTGLLLSDRFTSRMSLQFSSFKFDLPGPMPKTF